MDEESNERVQQYLLDNDIKEAWLGLIQSMDGVLNQNIYRQSVSFLYGEGNIFCLPQVLCHNIFGRLIIIGLLPSTITTTILYL